MQNLVNTIAEQRKSHIDGIENLTLKKIQQIVSSFMSLFMVFVLINCIDNILLTNWSFPSITGKKIICTQTPNQS